MATDKSDQDVEALRADIEALRNDVSAVTKSLSDLARNRADGLKNAAWSRAESVRDDLNDAVEDWTGRGRRQVDRIEQEIHERPIVSLLTAFGLGLLLGKLLDRR